MKYLILILILLNAETLSADNNPLFKGHSKKVNTLAFSPDGQLLATASDDNTIRIWSVHTGRKLKVLKGHTDNVLCIDFSPDGRKLLSGSRDSQIKLWNITSAKEIRTFKSHKSSVNSVKFSPKGDYFISGSSDNSVRYWKINKKKSIAVLIKHKASVNHVCFSPNGKYFTSASNDKTFKLWQTSSQKLVKTYKRHYQAVKSVCFSPNSKYIYSASAAGVIRVWKTTSTKEIKMIPAHFYSVNSLEISKDGSFLFSGSDDGKLKTWDLKTFENIYTYTQPDYQEIKDIKLSPNQKKIAFTNTSKIPQLITAKTDKTLIDSNLSNIWVVIVGISQYKYKENSKYSVNDALRIYGFYKSPEGGALNDKQIRILTNDGATKINIVNAINETFSLADKNDIVIFYYSGHGEKDGLVPYNANENTSNINYEVIINAIDNSKAKHKICIIDACYSGSISSETSETEDNIKKYNYESDIAFLLSSKAQEQAFGYRNLKQGVFSFFFIEGLKGNANENSDNIITIHELFNYVNYQVKAYTNYNQNPILVGKFDENLRVGTVF